MVTINIWSREDRIAQKLLIEKVPTYTLEISGKDVFFVAKAFGQEIGKSIAESLESKRD